jgi:hypothetical protein
MTVEYPNPGKRMPRPQYLYVIQYGPTFKIGVSLNPKARVKAMMLPDEPDLVRCYEVQRVYDLERALHKTFKDRREYGEWFRLTDDHMAEIDRLVDTWKQTARYAA